MTNYQPTITLVDEAVELFRKKYGSVPTMASSAPGRVSIMGGHIDHCNGIVLPMAISRRTVLMGRPNGTSSSRFATSSDQPDFEFRITSRLLEPTYGRAMPYWSNYILGVFTQFPNNTKGIDVFVHSDIPVGSGLSSSAALEVATYTLLETLTSDCSRSSIQKILQCQIAENDWANVPCGIMDQAICVLGRKATLLQLNCLTMATTYISFTHPSICFVIANSNKKHSLKGSDYSNRRAEAAKVKEIVRNKFANVKSHQDITLAMLEAVRDEIPETTYKIGLHVVGEIRRTLEFSQLMDNLNSISLQDKLYFSTERTDATACSPILARAGQLMFESHASSSRNYNVSTPELDQLVEIARCVSGVYGSRLTGGGFGGCTVTMVEKNCVSNLEMAIHAQYMGKATILTSEACDGARIEF
eukprot:CFRG8545T1